MRLHRSFTALVAIFALTAFAMAPAAGYACGDKDNCALTCGNAGVIKANAGGSNCDNANKADAKDANAKSCDGAKTTTAGADKAGCTKPCTKPCPSSGATTTSASTSGSCTDKAAGVTTAAATPADAHTIFGVAYMTCNGCATQVADAIKKVSGVRSVGVCYKSGIADVDFDNNKCSSNDIIKAVENAGYHAQMGAYTAEELESYAKGSTNTEANVSNASAGTRKSPCSGSSH